MPEIPSWDKYYLDICKVVAARSKDPNTQIGCVIIGPNHEIRSTGYNSFPRGIRDDVPERLVRPTKYLWIEHAERNAICNAARAGTATEGCTLYVEIMPCMDCARAIVQAGITEVVISAERMAQWKQADSLVRLVDSVFLDSIRKNSGETSRYLTQRDAARDAAAKKAGLLGWKEYAWVLETAARNPANNEAFEKAGVSTAATP